MKNFNTKNPSAQNHSNASREVNRDPNSSSRKPPIHNNSAKKPPNSQASYESAFAIESLSKEKLKNMLAD